MKVCFPIDWMTSCQEAGYGYGYGDLSVCQIKKPSFRQKQMREIKVSMKLSKIDEGVNLPLENHLLFVSA